MMKIPSRTGGLSSKRLYLPASHIEKICNDALRSVRLLPETPSAVRIERFIEKKFGFSPEYAALPAGVLGYTELGTAGPGRIVVDRGLAEADSVVAERRISTTLAHEAGHCLFHAHLFGATPSSAELFNDDEEHSLAPKILCRDEPSPSYDGKWWEYQANAAIGPLLLPQELVIQAVQPFLECRGLLGLPTLADRARRPAELAIAETFNVNPIVSRIRLSEMFPPDAQPTL
jgi:hypothetical protein